MKKRTFDAEFIYTSEEDTYYLLGFSDAEYNFENYVMLQLAYEFDEDDINTGMDGEYFEYNGQDNCGYKHVVKAYINNRRIQFMLENFKGGIDCIEVGLENITVTPQTTAYLKIILGDKLTIEN